MFMTLPLAFDATMLGLEYALLVVGVYITFRILDIADLTVDGSFVFGMAVSARLCVAGQPLLGLALGAAAGALAGLVTGLLITRSKVNPLLAGIITMTGLYSINTYVLGGPNVSLLDCTKVYEVVGAALGGGVGASTVKLGMVVAIDVVAVVLLSAYFRTESGLSVRATGDNEEMCRASSINTNRCKVGGLMLANALVGLTGALIAQYQGYADLSSGSGMVMIGLASVIIGELFGGRRSVSAGLACSVVGSVAYRLVIQVALSAKLIDANGLKLVTAVIVAFFMSLPALRAAVSERRDRASARREAARTCGEVPADEMLGLHDVGKTFNAGTPMEHRALDGVELELDRGEFACVVGSNGAGKSTLFNMVAGSILPDTGIVRIARTDVTGQPDYRRARRMSRVFQDPMKGTFPHLTVAENIALAYGRSSGGGLAFAIRPGRREFIRERLAGLGFGLEERMDVKVGMLSGGQRQAVTLLMSTIGEPDLLLLDEHTAALDPQATQRILDLTERIVAEHGITTLMITHNLASALTMGNRTIVMDRGRVVADVSGEERASMGVDDLLALYRDASGHDLDDDKVLLEK